MRLLVARVDLAMRSRGKAPSRRQHAMIFGLCQAVEYGANELCRSSMTSVFVIGGNAR